MERNNLEIHEETKGSWPALNAVPSGERPVPNTTSSVMPRLVLWEAIAHQSESLKQLTTMWLKAHPINENLLRSTLCQVGLPSPNPRPSPQTLPPDGKTGALFLHPNSARPTTTGVPSLPLTKTPEPPQSLFSLFPGNSLQD